MKTAKGLRVDLRNEYIRSAWNKGVKEYALELVEFLIDNELEITKENMLNGAKDWSEFSYGGSSLIYDGDIAARTCSPSEYKKCKEGERMPNANETWLDVQARALYQAQRMIIRLAK